MINLRTCADSELFAEFKPLINVISTYLYNQKIIDRINPKLDNPLATKYKLARGDKEQSGHIRLQLGAKFGIKPETDLKRIDEILQKIDDACETRAAYMLTKLLTKNKGEVSKSDISNAVISDATTISRSR